MGLIDQIEFYTDWVNNEFRLSWKDHYVEDLIEDCSSGVYLALLINAIFDEDIPILHDPPGTSYERQQNVQLCFPILREEGVNLTGVTVKGISEGDVDIIISLCAAIKRRKGVGFRRWRSWDNPQESFLGNQSNDGEYVNKDVDWLYSKNNSLLDQSDQRNETNTHSDLLQGSNNRKVEFEQSAEDVEGQTFYDEISFLANESQRNPFMDGHMMYQKEDIELFDWISKLLNVPVSDYGSFADGIVIFQLLNKIIPNCVSSKVFYSLPKTERIQLLLETACHELYLTTHLTALDVIQQRNFSHFRIFLTYLKSCVPSQSHRENNQKKFSLKELTTELDIKYLESSGYLKVDNTETSRLSSSPSKGPLKRENPPSSKSVQAKVNEEKHQKAIPKKILPTIHTEYVSPTWSKILNEELQLRASRNESRLSSGYLTPVPATESGASSKRDNTENSQKTIKREEKIPASPFSEELTIFQASPIYNPDTERITKYDNEIAAIFDGSDDDEESTLHSSVAAARTPTTEKSVGNINSKTSEVTDTDARSTTSLVTAFTGNSKTKNKFLEITDVVRSMSRSPSGSSPASKLLTELSS
ncbi:uncharacterized protein [Clytia hemisphaerica]|uniref:Calponin-homology (CH) domain-containing protein n=1 Tax=Clytia hemisphaerica TaxID=252671 RepID=A0A7M5VFP3_9CNID